MGTKNFSNANDLITFSRSSAGTALRKIAYGDELVTNGGFDTDSDWTKGTGWTISGGVAAAASVPAFQAIVQFGLGIVSGKLYQASADVTVTAGNCRFFLGASGDTSVASEIISTSQTVSWLITGSSTDQLLCRAQGSGFTGTIDNISVKEVLFDDASGDLTLFNHPADVPRIEYDADGNVLGLLVEEARTNLIEYSEDFKDSYWSKLSLGNGSAPVLTENYATAPDGTNTATRLQASISSDDPVGGDFSLLQRAFSTSGSHTSSIWVKSNTSENQEVYFRIASNQVVTVTPEWTRISATSASTTTYLTIGVRDDLGDPNVDILIWGAQYEAGAFPTSYIPTAGATATRSADVASIPVADFGYNQSEGTLFAEYKRFGSGNAWVAYLGESTNTYISLGNGNSGTVVRMQVNEGGTLQASLDTASVVTGTTYRQAGAFKDNDFSATENGNAVHTDTSGTLPDGITFLDIGEQYGNYLNGHIKSIKYFPRKLSAAQLQELTT